MAVWSRGGPSVRLAARLAARQLSLRLGWSVMSTAASSSGRTPGGDGSSAVVLSFRLFAVALASGILFMGVALFFILDAAAAPPAAGVITLLVLGLVDHLALGTLRARAEPLPVGSDVTATKAEALRRFRSSFMIRIVLAESPALIGIVLAFVLTPQAWLVYAVGAVVGLTLIAVHVWPSRRTIGPFVDVLESEGADSGLRELFGFGGS